MTTIMPLLDAVTYQVSLQNDADLGMQRLPMLLGVAVIPLVSSYFVGVAIQANNGKPDYSPVFIIFIISLSICLGVGYFIAPTIKRPVGHIARNVKKLLANPKIAAFIVGMFFTGAMWGFLEKWVSLITAV